MSVIRQPSLVPVIDSIEIGSVIEALVAGGNSPQIPRLEHVEGGDPLQVNGIIEVVSPKSARSIERHGQVEEASIGRRVGHVGREIYGRSVDFGIGRDVGHSGQKVVHHAGVISVVDGWSVEAGLQDVGVEKGSAQGHVMQVQQGRSVGKDGIDVDLLDVGQVGDGVLAHFEVAHMLNGTIVAVHRHVFGKDFVESISAFPNFVKGFIKLSVG